MKKVLKVTATVFKTVSVLMAVLYLILCIYVFLSYFLSESNEGGIVAAAEIFSTFVTVFLTLTGFTISLMMAWILNVFSKNIAADAIRLPDICALISAIAINCNFYILCFDLYINHNMNNVFLNLGYGAIFIVAYVISLIEIRRQNIEAKRMNLATDVSSTKAT